MKPRISYVMTPKERMLKSLQGELPDVLPAAPCYLSLYLADSMRTHYIEQYRQCLNGRPRYPVDHAQDTFFQAQALYHSYRMFRNPPDWIEVDRGLSKAGAERIEIVSQDGIIYYEDRQSGRRLPMKSAPLPKGDDPLDDTHPFSSLEEMEARMPIISSEEMLASGEFDLPRQVVSDYGDQYFISTILDTPYSELYGFLGFRDFMVTQRRNPDLFHRLLQRRLLQSKQEMEAWAAVGIHGVFVEEVFSGATDISPQNYAKFVYPYNLSFFQHMRSSALIPIHYVCGDVIPRLKQMINYDIAAIAVEEGKKNFRNDFAEVVEQVDGHCAVFGNIDTIQFGLHATPEEMSAEVARQAVIGMQARGFIVSTGSPFPLETSPHMIDTLVSAAHSFINSTG